MGKTSIIQHKDGTCTRVVTNDNGSHSVEKTGSGAAAQEIGADRSHDDVVKSHMGSDDSIILQQ